MDERYIPHRDRGRVMPPIDRQALFEEFCQACDAGERLALDELVTRMVEKAHKKGVKNFGPDAAKEVIISLVLWSEQQDREKKRQTALERKYGYPTRQNSA